DVVNAFDADGLQSLLEPFGRLAYLHAPEDQSDVTGAISGIFHTDGQRTTRPFPEILDGRIFQALAQHGGHVPCYSYMGSGISPVRSKADLEHPIVLQSEVLLQRSARNGVFRQYHDTLMTRTQPDLVLCAK